MKFDSGQLVSIQFPISAHRTIVFSEDGFSQKVKDYVSLGEGCENGEMTCLVIEQTPDRIKVLSYKGPVWIENW